MIAKVIVDVPAKQTNRAFDYVIPFHLESWVEIGSRVAVTFGSRWLQGFVVDIVQVSDQDVQKLKMIDDVLDITPALTKELVQLATWISQTYFCHDITSLQAMLPTALKSKYDKRIRLGHNNMQLNDTYSSLIQEIIDFISTKTSVGLLDIHKKFPQDVQLIKKLISQGILTSEPSMKDSLSTKKILMARVIMSPQQLREMIQFVSSNAKKQKEVLQYFIENQADMVLSELLTHLQVNASTIKVLAQRGVIELIETEVQRDPYASHHFNTTQAKALTDEQQHAFDQIHQQLHENQFKTYVLHGITGSGKTEIYLQTIQTCLDLGKKSILLVPEISLTPQIVQRFKERFGKKVAVWHSRLSAGERYDEWRKMRNQEVDIVVGARSAIFAPFVDIGLIIIDEEHEATYKQEETPKYHARDIAITRAKFHNAVVILGSATPSLESIYAATHISNSSPHTGEAYTLLSLTSRVENRPLPPVKVVDMRDELKLGNRSMFSRPLYEAIEHRLVHKEQMIILLNRRGYATFVMCRSCGYVCTCPHCEISMTFHHMNQSLRCHYCGYAENMVTSCPTCSSTYIRQFGTGTQRIEEELSALFPGIRIIRMDMDTTTEKGSHEKWLSQFERGEADVLLGTQMVAKGLDFPNVTLVGVLAADSSLNIADFRAQERTFQLLTQVAGRAGRHQKAGEVIIQSYTPDHPIIQAARHHDYWSYAQQELHLREKLQYPPYQRLIAITLSHEISTFLISMSQSFATKLKEGFQLLNEQHSINIKVLGPVPSPIAKIKNRYRYQCVIKYPGEVQLNRAMIHMISQSIHFFDDQIMKQKLQISVDVDPQYMM